MEKNETIKRDEDKLFDERKKANQTMMNLDLIADEFEINTSEIGDIIERDMFKTKDQRVEDYHNFKNKLVQMIDFTSNNVF